LLLLAESAGERLELLSLLVRVLLLLELLLFPVLRVRGGEETTVVVARTSTAGASQLSSVTVELLFEVLLGAALSALPLLLGLMLLLWSAL
jgi:hypothetical protein